MKAQIGLNILPMGGLHNRATVMQWIKDNAPHEAMLVMNDTGFALEAAPYVKHMIHRTQFSGDDSIWNSGSPQQFVDSLPALGENIYHQILNEPGGGQLDELENQKRMAKWVADAMVYAGSKRKRLAGPSHAVGCPHESFFGLGVYDAILRSLRIPNEPSQWHLLLQHEYFVNDAATEQPHHVGRVFEWNKRARYLGLPVPKLVIGESGRDVQGGKGIHGDGWKNAAWYPKTPEEYVSRLVRQATVYRAYGYPMLVFCAGEGFGDWISFDIQNEPAIFKGIAAYNMIVPDIRIGGASVPAVSLPEGTTTAPGKVIQMPGAFVNLREAPDALSADVGDVLLNEEVQYADTEKYPDWYWVKKKSGVAGWISKQKSAAKPVLIEMMSVVNPPVEGAQPFTKDELLSIALHHEAIAKIFRDAAARL